MSVQLKVWRQAGPEQAGRLVDYTADNVHPDMSFLEMLDVVNESLIKQGRGSDRVRLGLPRGHLRQLRPGDRRHRARPRQGHDDLPGAHAPVQERRHHHHRAVPRQGLPGHQGSGGRSIGVRPHHRGGRLRVDERRRRAGRQQPADRRRTLPTRRWIRRSASAAAPASRPARTPRRTCSRPRRSRTSGCCRKAKPSAAAAWCGWSIRWMRKASAACSNEGECEAVCPKEISISNIARMNRDFLKAIVR